MHLKPPSPFRAFIQLVAFVIFAALIFRCFQFYNSIHFKTQIDNNPYRLTRTKAYEKRFPSSISPDGAKSTVLKQLKTHLRTALFEAESNHQKLTRPTFRSKRAITVEPPLEKYGYQHNDTLVRPLCLDTHFVRTPSAAPDAKPLCFNVFRNAFLGAQGVVIEPLSKTVYESSGGCCEGDWAIYHNKIVSLSKEQLSSVKKFKGKIVLSLSHHHSTTYHHVMYEVIPRYLLSVPLLEAVPSMLVAVDDGDIAPALMQLLGLSPRRILRFNGNQKPQWRFASLLLAPPVLHRHAHLGYYPPKMIRDVAEVFRGLPRSSENAVKDGKPTMLVIERAKSRFLGGRCAESRCLRNFQEMWDALQEQFGERFQLEVYRAMDDVKIAIDMFARARVVVGVHGAGFQNMMFCKENTTVIHIGLGHEYDWLANLFGLRIHLMKVDGLMRNTKGFVIDVNDVVRNVSSAIDGEVTSG